MPSQQPAKFQMSCPAKKTTKVNDTGTVRIVIQLSAPGGKMKKGNVSKSISLGNTDVLAVHAAIVAALLE